MGSFHEKSNEVKLRKSGLYSLMSLDAFLIKINCIKTFMGKSSIGHSNLLIILLGTIIILILFMHAA